MIDYNISKYIDTDEVPNAVDSTEVLNNIDITEGTDITEVPNAEVPNADTNDDIIPNNSEAAETTETENTEDVDTKYNTKVPDILGNNKLGYNIWDTIVKGV